MYRIVTAMEFQAHPVGFGWRQLHRVSVRFLRKRWGISTPSIYAAEPPPFSNSEWHCVTYSTPLVKPPTHSQACEKTKLVLRDQSRLNKT